MSVLESLEICFTANLDGVNAQLDGLSGRLTGLSSAVSAAAGSMGAAGAALAAGLRSGLAAGMPGIRQEAALLGRQAVEAVSAIRAGMQAQGMTLSRGFVEGVRAGGVLAGSVAQGIAQSVRFVGDGASAKVAGAGLSQGFVEGVRVGGALAGSVAQGIAQSVRFVGGEGSARSSGLMLSKGFAAGIRSGGSAVNAAVSSIVNAATKKIRSLLSIHSPSKVTEGFGEFFGEGFAQDIGGSAAEVVRAADALGGAAMTGLQSASLPEMDVRGEGVVRMVQSAVNSALGGVQLTIPLNVDGMKLGEASIRGINAVTRSAGRVLLNI